MWRAVARDSTHNQRPRPSGSPTGVAGLRRVTGVVAGGVWWFGCGSGGYAPAVCDRGRGRAARVALAGRLPELGPREWCVRRSRTGDGAGPIPSRAGAAAGGAVDGGIAAGAGVEAICSSYGIPRAEVSRRGSRHPARAALAYVARQRTTATHAELMGVLGVSRPGSVPNLTRRFAAWLRSDVRVREPFQRIEEELDRLGPPEGCDQSGRGAPPVDRNGEPDLCLLGSPVERDKRRNVFRKALRKETRGSTTGLVAPP
jgi:hypothetical protein